MNDKQVSADWLRRFVAETAAATWVVDADGYVVDVPEWVALTGQDFKDKAGDGWMTALHPEDLDRVRSASETAVTHRTIYNADYRLRCADGIYRWFNARGIPMLNSEGGVLKWFGVILPIAAIARLVRGDNALRAQRADHFRDINPRALRATRALLDWSADKLAEVSGVFRSTIRRFEGGESMIDSRRGSIEKTISVLAIQKVKLVGSDGVIDGVLGENLEAAFQVGDNGAF